MNPKRYLLFEVVCQNVINLSSQAPETCVNLCFKLNLGSMYIFEKKLWNHAIEVNFFNAH